MEIDIPNDIRGFIDEVVDSFVMWDLLIFCSKKGTEAETPAHVAELLGRPAEELMKPVQKLKKIGLVEELGLPGNEVGCRLDRRSSRFPELEKFWAYNENQENRLRILSYLLQKKTR